jgi:hypothetical protein
MFIAQRTSATLSVRKSGIRSNLQGIAMPLFRTEPEEDGVLAINIALLRSGGPDIVLFRVLTFARGSLAYRTPPC